MTEFKVGDRVRVNGFKDSVISDIAYDPEHKNSYFYVDGNKRESRKGWDATSLKLIGKTDCAPAIDAHYTKYAIQPMEFSLANGLDPAQHTVIKYVVRYRDKHGVRDLRAAIRVLELMIERAERDDG